MSKFFDWVKRNGATILSWVATAGTIAIPFVADKDGKRAAGKLSEAWVNKSTDADDTSVELTKWEKFKVAAPCYIPTILTEAATVGCIHGSNVLNKREIKKGQLEIQKLTRSLGMTAAAYCGYRNCVGALTDKETEEAALKMTQERRADEANGGVPWTEVRTFYIDGQPELFERTMEQVWKAEFEANRKFIQEGCVTLNDFYRLLGLPEIPEGDKRGWESYIGEAYYGYTWIDFAHEDYTLQSELVVTEIRMVCDPHPLTEEEASAEIDEAIKELG